MSMEWKEVGGVR